MVSIITNPNNQEGFRIDPELQKSVLQSIRNYPTYSIGTGQLINNLFIVLNKLFPEVNNNPDVKWDLTNSLQPHVQKMLKQKFEWRFNISVRSCCKI